MSQTTNNDNLKLYTVRATIHIDVPVVAESEEEARKICAYSWRQELENVEDDDAMLKADVLDALPVDFEGCLAYWDPKYASDPRTDHVCDEWFAEELNERREAAGGESVNSDDKADD